MHYNSLKTFVFFFKESNMDLVENSSLLCECFTKLLVKSALERAHISIFRHSLMLRSIPNDFSNP